MTERATHDSIESAEAFRAHLAAAWLARSRFHDDPTTDCYRIFHGYAEGLPGLSIDRYGSAAVINKKIDLPFAEVALVHAVRALFPFDRVIQKSHQRVATTGSSRVQFLHGERSNAPHHVREHDALFFADLDDLHTNGLFLDARPARRWLREHSRGRRVYNLFAHTGSLGVAAMLGGAKDVLHLDKSEGALAKIRLSYELNGIKPDPRGILKGDLYYHLPRAIKRGHKFQGIILDPPPFLPIPYRARDHRPEGQDFGTLITFCRELLEPDGWLLSIYHDFRKSHDECDDEIVRFSGGKLSPIWRDRADPDFPELDPNRWTRMSAFLRRC